MGSSFIKAGAIRLAPGYTGGAVSSNQRKAGVPGKMAQNQKLTELLQGKTIASTSNRSGTMTVGFTDCSQLTVQTGEGSSNSAATGGTVQEVKAEGNNLSLVLEGGDSLRIPLAAEASGILLRDKDGKQVYAA